MRRRSIGRSTLYGRTVKCGDGGLGGLTDQAARYAESPTTNRARSSRSMSNGVMYFTPISAQAFGILTLRWEFATFSCVTTVWP